MKKKRKGERERENVECDFFFVCFKCILNTNAHTRTQKRMKSENENRATFCLTHKFEFSGKRERATKNPPIFFI
jgi:hypothetical protein